MKKTMRYLSMAVLALVGVVMTGCSNDDHFVDSLQQSANGDKVVTLTTTVDFESSEATRALTSDGVKTFSEGDRIAVIYKNTSDHTVKAVSDALPAGDYGATATFTVSLTNPKDGDIRYIYPASMAATTVATDAAVNAEANINYAALATQDGTLASIAANLDLATSDGTMTSATLPNLSLANKLAICAFTLKNGKGTADKSDDVDETSNITGMTLNDGTNSYAVTRTAAAGPIYVAIRPTSSADISYAATDGTHFYVKEVTNKTYEANHLYPLGLLMATTNPIDLARLTANFTAQDGHILTGTLGANVKISITAGATVTLDNATINGTDDSNYWWSGLNCLGDATIILADGSTNIVKGFDKHRAGIYFLTNKTLTIQGSTGRLNVSSNGWAAGIGGSYGDDCGNIRIEGGVITATGCYQCPGIGASSSCGTITITGGTITSTGGEEAPGIGARNCGKITITGGTVEATGGQYGAGIGCKKDGITDGIEIGGTANVTATGGEKAAGIGGAYCVGRNGTCGNISIGGTATVIATGGSKAAGIGSGYGFDNKSISSCGTITISNSVASVTAIKGTDATNSIGKGEGSNSTCGTVTIGGTEGAIIESPYTYTPPVPSAPTGAIDGLFSVSSTKQVYFSQGNLQATYDGSNWSWAFATNQWDYIGGKSSSSGSEPQTGNNYISGNGTLSANGTVDLFCWSTNKTYYGIHNSYDNNDYSGDFRNWGNNITGWRTLTNAEWGYLINTRTTTSGVRYAKAKVNNVNGVILLPDDWSTSYHALSSTNTVNAAFTANEIDASTWASSLEAHGAVFLPAAGCRYIDGENNNYVSATELAGFYWSSVPYVDSWNDKAYNLFFNPDVFEPSYSTKNGGCSVRLVKDAN